MELSPTSHENQKKNVLSRQMKQMNDQSIIIVYKSNTHGS